MIPAQQYEDAVHHLLTALSVQEADMEYDSALHAVYWGASSADVALSATADMQQTPPVNAAGVSHALWDSLHVSLIQCVRVVVASQSHVIDTLWLARRMHRSDLAPLCSARDLRSLLQAFASDQ